MRRCGFFRVILFGLSCLASLTVYGQKTAISKEDYSWAVQRAKDITRKFSYRLEGKSRAFRENEKKPVELSRWFYKLETPYSSHYASETKNAEQKKIKTNEIINVGNFEYTRTDGGEWQARRIRGGHSDLPIHSMWLFSDEEFYVTRDVRLHGQKAELFEYVAKTKLFRSPFAGSPPPKPIDIIHREKHWVTPEGLLLKVEIVSNGQPMNLNNDLVYETSVYKYDSKIKITAPIPEPKTDYTVY